MDRARYDVILIGGGPAGVSAALVLARARRRVAVVHGGAPRNPPAAHLHGFRSRDGTAPAGLLAVGRDEAAADGVESISGHVASIQPGFSVTLADGERLEAGRLLVATGATGEPPIRGGSDDLILFTHAHDLTTAEHEQLEARGIRVVDGEVRALVVEDDRLRGVVVGDGDPCAKRPPMARRAR